MVLDVQKLRAKAEELRAAGAMAMVELADGRTRSGTIAEVADRGLGLKRRHDRGSDSIPWSEIRTLEALAP